MKLHIYVMYDKVAEEAIDIQFMKSDAVALRWFGFTVETRFKLLDPKHFSLLKLGEYSTDPVNILVYDAIKEITPIAVAKAESVSVP